MGYPLQFGLDVCHEFLGIHSRGWEWVRQVFYWRIEHAAKLFCENQRAWYELKKVVKYYDLVLERTKIPATFPNKIPERMSRLWALAGETALDYTDSLDLFTYPLHQPSKTT